MPRDHEKAPGTMFDPGEGEHNGDETEMSLLSYVGRDVEGQALDAPSSTRHKSRIFSRPVRETIKTLLYWPEASSKKMRSTAWLDGLRGAAAFEVLLYHYHLFFLGVGYNPAYGSKDDTRQWWRLPFIRNFYHSGHAMVNVFFAISGFVLTYRSLMLIRTKQRAKLHDQLSSAVFRRAIRIFLPIVPISFVGMILIWTRLKVDNNIQRLETFQAQAWDWYIQTENFVNPFHDYLSQWDILHKYEFVMWTLPLEFFGSIVCYVTILACSRVTSYPKRCAIIISLMYFAFTKLNWWSFNFLAGTLLADFTLQQESQKSLSASLPNQHPRQLLIRGFWIVVFIWSFYVCGLPDSKPEDYNLPGFDWYYAHVPASQRSIEHGGRFWWMVAGISLTVSISQLSGLRRIFETTFCQYLGRVSFMLYLVHTYLYTVLGGPWRGFLTAHFATATYSPAFNANILVLSRFAEVCVYFFFWLVMLPIVLIVSGAVTRYIDEPAIKFAKYLENRFIDDSADEVSIPR